MKKLVIYGAGGFAQEVLWLIEEINRQHTEWEVLGFIDDNRENWGKMINHHPILGGRDYLNGLDETIYTIIAIGDGKIRKQIASQLVGRKYATLIHPNISISHTNLIGEGCIINTGALLTVNITLGNHVNVHFGCSVGHDAVLSDYVTLLPRSIISGGVKINQASTVGAGATILQYLEIGESTFIGSMANVIKDLPAYCTAVGNPAKVIKNSLEQPANR